MLQFPYNKQAHLQLKISIIQTKYKSKQIIKYWLPSSLLFYLAQTTAQNNIIQYKNIKQYHIMYYNTINKYFNLFIVSPILQRGYNSVSLKQLFHMETSAYSPITDFFNMDLVNTGTNIIKMTLICLAAWTYFFFMVEWLVHFPSLDLKKSNDTKNRIVSMVHGLTTFALSFKAVFLNNVDFDAPNTQLQNFIAIISMSYITYDLVACYFYNLFDFGLLAHHSLCIVGYLSALTSGYGSMVAIAGLFYAEISNFPMHARMICRNFGIRYSKAYEYSQNIYLISYIIARGIFCPIMLSYPVFFSKNVPWVVYIMCNLLIVQSFYYIWQMYGISMKKLKQYREMENKKIEYFWFSVNPATEGLSFVKKQQKQKIF